jgi:hypothetical protein
MTAFQDLGWRQGAVLTRDLALELIPLLEDSQVAVIVSQDCDLTHESLTVEPSFEVILARDLEDKRPEFEHGKNPRLLHIPFGKRWLECSMQQRHVLSRAKLLEYAPCDSIVLAKRERKQLAKWMGLRYSRTPFPTQFNKRIHANRKHVDQAKKACSMLSGIFLYVDDRELPLGQSYEVILIGLMPNSDDSSDADQDCRAEAEKGLEQLRKALNECQGIEVVEHALRSHREMTVHDLERLARWDMDYLSDRIDPEGPVAPRA